GDTYYRCGGQIKQRGRFEGRCRGKGILGRNLEPVVWADIEAWLRNPGDLLEELRGEASGEGPAAVLEASRTTLEAALEALDTRRERRLEQHERGQISDTELTVALDQITAERKEIEGR